MIGRGYVKIQKLALTGTCVFLFSLNLFSQPTTGESTFPKPAEVNNRAQAKTHVGILGGMNSFDGDEYDNSSFFGLDVGLQPYIPYAFGAEVLYSKNSGNERNPDLERFTTLLKGSYNFGGQNALISKSYVGLAAGAIFANENRRTDLVSGPLVGFDFPIVTHTNDMISVGAQLKYLLTSGSEPDAFLAGAALKYWF